MSGLLLSARDIQIGLALIEIALGDGAGFDERLGSFHLGLCELDLRRRARYLGLGAVDRDFERARVDGEENFSGLDDLAILEVDFVDETGDARADLHHLRGSEATGILIPLRHSLEDWGGHGNGHGRRLTLGHYVRGRCDCDAEQC